MNQHSISTEAAFSALKASPPVAVITADMSGLSLQDWVFIATLIYTVILTLHQLWKWSRELKREKDNG